nr:PREDICTED: uncharacterized protein LOC105662175 [Megachile rotundata]XP_012138182.1 PREDICTED: uncharacterized protein LOC105662175 [Megachile rotundata]
MSEIKYSAQSSSDFPEDQERCNNCGVILTENHQCKKWRRERDPRPRRNRCRCKHKDGTSIYQSTISERKSYEYKSVGTQTDAVANSRISTSTQTEDIDQNEEETYEELSRNIFEKMIYHKFLLLDLHNTCNRLKQ